MNERITVQFQIGQQTEESARLQQLMKTRTTAINEYVPRTVEEWRVTGEPGQGYPSYRFAFSGDRYEDPETAARAYVGAMSDWADGPHLSHRTVTYTAWEDVIDIVHLIADGEAVTSCCGRTPFELPRWDRITVDPKLGRGCG